jgi:adenylate cyclase
MTVLFSDVRGFTTISEAYKDDPQGLTRLMNRFLTPLTNAIVARQGTIDKYMGDAVMAFWNAPLDDPQHQLNACRAARDMLERVEELNRVREKEAAAAGAPFIPIKMGIGINTGPCAVGNMGSDLRFQYTVMGDSVNLASRIEGVTKDFGVSIILGARTAQAVAGDFAVLEIDSIRVKGKTEPETIYTLMGGPEMLQSNEHRVLQERWTAFLAAWRRQDWAGARQAISRCRSLCVEAGLGGVLDLYADRLRQLGQGALLDGEEPRAEEARRSTVRGQEASAAQAQLAKPEVITSS